MAKSKLANGKAAKSADPLTSVKSAGVTKASSTPVAKSKKLAKEIAVKASNGKDKKNKKKVESESESESDSSESEDDSDDSDDSDASDDNGAAVKSDEDSDDSDSDDSESDSDDEDKKPAAKAKVNGKAEVSAPKTNGKVKAADSDSSDDSDEEEDSDDSDEEEDAPKKTKPAAVNGKKESAKADSSDENDSDDSDSDDSDESDEEEDEKEEEKPEPSKKRKAEEEVSTPFKKTKAADSEEEAATTLFVGNLGWAVDDDSLYQTFQECEGLVSARVVTDKAMQRSRGFGYVDFSSADACQAALEKMQGFELEGRGLRLDPSKPKPEDSTPGQRANDRAQRHGDTVSPESDTLFVGNLPFDADEEAVSEFFSEVAEVKSLRLPTDQESGNRKGFGYVTFNSIEDAKSAFDTKNGAFIGYGRGARAVRLDYAAQRQPREGGGFGGGFGGGRGGGGRGGRGGGRGGFGDRGGRGGGRGGFGDRGGRGGGRGGFGGRGGGFQGKKITF